MPPLINFAGKRSGQRLPPSHAARKAKSRERRRRLFQALRKLKVRHRRRRLGLSVKRLAGLAGLDWKTVAEVERGRRLPSTETLERLGAALTNAETDIADGRRLTPEMVRPRRVRLGLTHQQLGDEAGLCKRTIWRVENKHEAREATLQAIQEVLDRVEGQPATGDVLRQRREAKGLRMEDLARQSGVCKKTIYTVENGKHRPEPGTLKKLFAALDTAPAMPPVSTVRERRQILRATLGELGKASGVNYCTISVIERGASCHPTTRRKLEHGLRVLAEKQQAQTRLDLGANPTGEEIRRARLAAGWTQVAFACRVGISPGALRLIENGGNVPRPRALRKIEEVLAVPPSAGARKGRRLYPRQQKITGAGGQGATALPSDAPAAARAPNGPAPPTSRGLHPTEKRIVELVQAGPLPGKVIASRLRLDYGHARRLLARLVRRGILTNDNRGYGTSKM